MCMCMAIWRWFFGWLVSLVFCCRAVAVVVGIVATVVVVAVVVVVVAVAVAAVVVGGGGGGSCGGGGGVLRRSACGLPSGLDILLMIYLFNSTEAPAAWQQRNN